MSQTIFTQVSIDELAARHDVYWLGALTALTEAQEIEVPQISSRMPYAAAQAAYVQHVDKCITCQDEPWWSEACATGSRLATLSADAMAAQEDLAAQN